MPTLDDLLVWPARNLIIGTTNANLHNATDWAATFFRVPRSGNMVGVTFYTSAVTTGATLVGTLETPDGSYPSAPSGTLVDANATGTVVVANTDDSVLKRINFAGNVAVTAGVPMWLKFAVSSGTPNTLGIRNMLSTSIQLMEPYMLKRESGAESYGASALAVIFHYDDGDEVLVQTPGTNQSYSISSSSNPREIGAKMRPPWSGRSTGAYVRMNLVTADATFDVILYDDADNVLATVSYNGNDFGTTGVISGMRWVPWPTPVEIQKGEWYRLVCKGQSASAWTGGISGIVPLPQCPASALEFLADYHLTYRGAAGGVWTDDTDRHVYNHLVFDRLYLPDQSHQF